MCDVVYVCAVHNSAAVCTRTVHSGTYLETAENPNAQWGTLLSQYTRSFKQLESMLEDIDPLFHLNEVIPTKVTDHPAMIPFLLSTHMEKPLTDGDNGQPESSKLSQEEEASLATSLASYNNRIENLVCNLPTQPN